MLTFAVVVARSGCRVPRRVLDHLRDRTCRDVPFDPGQHLVWSNEAETVWFGGWQDVTDEESAAHHWHVDPEGLTAFAGQIWPRLDGWRGVDPWSGQLAQYLRSTPLTAGTEDLAGIYVAASLHPRGRSSVGADPLGIGLIYWGEGRDVVIISSRAELAAGILAAEHGSPPARDTLGTGWRAYSGQPMGLRTGSSRRSACYPRVRLSMSTRRARPGSWHHRKLRGDRVLNTWVRPSVYSKRSARRWRPRSGWLERRPVGSRLSPG